MQQDDWERADLRRWSHRIDETLAREGGGPWIAAAHSFGVLALVDHLARVADSPIRAALLVAPADPERFGVAETLSRRPLPCACTVVLSDDDPCLPLVAGRRWAGAWGSPVVILRGAGHVNVASGFGPFPFAREWARGAAQRLSRARRAAEVAGSSRAGATAP